MLGREWDSPISELKKKIPAAYLKSTYSKSTCEGVGKRGMASYPILHTPLCMHEAFNNTSLSFWWPDIHYNKISPEFK